MLISCGEQKLTELTDENQTSNSPYSPKIGVINTGKDLTLKQGESFSLDPSTRFSQNVSSGYTFSLKPSDLNLSWLSVNSSTGLITGKTKFIGVFEGITVIAQNTMTSEKIESTSYSIGINGDPLRVHAWHLENTGQSTFANSGGVSGVDINMDDLHVSGSTGRGIKIAISDNGVEINHDDLHLNTISGAHRNYTLSPPYIGDPLAKNAHGTAVAGIAAATGWNNLGSVGVAPEAKFAGFQFLESSQTSARLMHQASGDFDIFNFSYGDTLYLDTISNADYIDRLRLETIQNKKVYVKAAGNEFLTGANGCLSHNANLPFENESPFMIVVGAVDASGKKAFYSNAGSNIWVSGPGGDRGNQGSGGKPAILTTDLPTCLKGYSKAQNGLLNSFEYKHSENLNCNYTSTMNGTSAATPVVSGVVALIKEANPNLTYRDIKHILAKTAKKIDPTHSNVWGKKHPSAAKSGCGDALDLTGHDHELGWVKNTADYEFNNFYGFGLVDAKAAVTLAKSYAVNSFGTLIELNPSFDKSAYQNDSISLVVPDQNKDGVTDVINITDDIIVESVQIKVAISTAASGDIGVELTSPGGTRSILLNVNNSLLAKNDANLNIVLASHAFYGEDAKGDWTIKIIDGYTGDIATLTSWKINILGHAK